MQCILKTPKLVKFQAHQVTKIDVEDSAREGVRRFIEGLMPQMYIVTAIAAEKNSYVHVTNKHTQNVLFDLQVNDYVVFDNRNGKFEKYTEDSFKKHFLILKNTRGSE